MARLGKKIDKVRASRDGHEFHEAWAARKALQLVMSTDGLSGIAIEGLAPEDQADYSDATVEVADLVLYYGNKPTFDQARAVVVVQLKYSKRSQSVPFRMSDAKKTIQKFASAYRGHKRRHGVKGVKRKLSFELITNRPIAREFREAIHGLASEVSLKGKARTQAAQFATACGLKANELRQFAQKIAITGLAGSLKQNKQQLSRVLADWSVARDAMARARLGNLRQLLRDKAGLAGEMQNVVMRTDVLDALEVQSAADLLPCPTSFPEVGKIVKREQLYEVVSRIPKLSLPLLVHADGGVGKTVFLQSVAKSLAETHEVILFDCFGGGAYRAPEDGRHLPERGLIHIVNSLACHGLCDPLLPINENRQELIKAFRSRLVQAVSTLQRGSRGKQLLLFLDAIDNAAEHAKDKGEVAFPRLLLESVHLNGPIAGMQLIASCRTYRRHISRGDIPCEEFALMPFSIVEAKQYLHDRIPRVTDVQVQVAYSRSEGNPRILEHLALSDRGLLEPSEINKVITLDELLNERIQRALGEALKRGYSKPEIDAFLAGLAVLPPPVPLDEYADAHGIELSAVRSFAVDLAPLLERTRHGLIFRDEPTESLVRENYAAKVDTLRSVAKNLLRNQGTSVYAASTLPILLQRLGDKKLLFDLAFDKRFPATITSSVGKQNIRYARLKAAVRLMARDQDFDRLVHLLIELSTLAAINQRGTDYVLDNPDLVVASRDVDATRRLFETRTAWPGTRHARLAIASALSGDLSDAYRNARNADEWLQHFYRQSEDYRRERGGPQRLDIAAIPLCLIAQGRGRDAARWMKGWMEWYAYEVAEHLFGLLQQAQEMGTVSTTNLRHFLDSLKLRPGLLAAALSFLELDKSLRSKLVRDLAGACVKNKHLETNKEFYRERNFLVQDGLLKSAAIAVAMNMNTEALAIAKAAPHQRPRLWSVTDQIGNTDVFHFIVFSALEATIRRKPITEHTLLPQELHDIGLRVPATASGDSFRRALKSGLEEQFKTYKESPDETTPLNHRQKADSERFIDGRHAALLEMSRAFAALLASRAGRGDKPFLKLVDVWAELRKRRERYSDAHEANPFFDLLGRRLLVFAIWARYDLKALSVEAFVAKISEDNVASAPTIVEIIAILAKRSDLQEMAGKMAIKAKARIEGEDEVSYRASLFGQLSRAIMPASLDETTSYFRTGLEQMDAIGSGDHVFTSELLFFAEKLRGAELREEDFHTLSNICELNMSSEEERFPWAAFARGLSRTSGYKMLAKLGRWNDRDKISLDYTLLPYLVALVEQDKIDPSIALGLLRLSNPAELHVCGTEQFAEVIASKRYPNSKELLTELIVQFQQNHPGVFMPSTLSTLQQIAERELGRDSEYTSYLTMAVPRFKDVLDENNENSNYHDARQFRGSDEARKQKAKSQRVLKKIVDKTEPADEKSMLNAVEELNGMQQMFELKGEFFENLRRKVKYAERPTYIRIVAGIEIMDIYSKLRELKECRDSWSNSSASLEQVFREVAPSLIKTHAFEFVRYDYLSSNNLTEISDISGVSLPVLALELIDIFAKPESHLPASIWMGLAGTICDETKGGEGQAALARLLNSSSTKLASSVVDGAWKCRLYPTGGEIDVAAGLVWFALGSPSARYRWRAAHSVRCFARFGRWDVIGKLIGKIRSTDAHPYQAPELPFYFLHARLWLLIAIARIAMEYPADIARYEEALKTIVFDESEPHVLMRHFATQALLICNSRGSIALTEEEVKALQMVNVSPFKGKVAKEYSGDSFYQSRPESMPEPIHPFHLEYDFDKTDVTRISDVFERLRWETKDGITAWVRKYDPHIVKMYESGGRSDRRRDSTRGMTQHYHLYGQQLAWHALYLVAGDFLARYPTARRTDDNEDLWHRWLRGELLTRQDGLWLADGIDWPPVEAQINVYEKGETGLVLTGDRAKLLSLLGIESSIADNLVVAGNWRSVDGIEIDITSALVPRQDAAQVALQLSREEPFRAWLPRVEQYDDDDGDLRSEKEPLKPWIVWPSTERGLDGADPIGATSVVRRPYYAKAIAAVGSLKAIDPFGRKWAGPDGIVVTRSEAWGGSRTYNEEESANGERLVCNSGFLKEVLLKQSAELLLLLILRRYDKSQFRHTMAVVRVSESLDFEFYLGLVNKLHVMKH